MNAITAPKLGLGIYTIGDVSRYVGSGRQTARRLFKARSDTKEQPILRSDYTSTNGLVTVSFLNLIDALVATELHKRGFSGQQIRKIYSYLKADLETDHPFCHREIYTSGRELFYRVAEGLIDEPLNLRRGFERQEYFGPVMKGCLDKVEYSDWSQLAQRWRIAVGIVIDPAIGFGKPVIDGRSISAAVLAASYFGNGENAAFVAQLFEVDVQDVLNAVAFSNRFGELGAAA